MQPDCCSVGRSASIAPVVRDAAVRRFPPLIWEGGKNGAHIRRGRAISANDNQKESGTWRVCLPLRAVFASARGTGAAAACHR